jgi:hypothetical protein
MTPKDKAKELVDKFTVIGLQQRNEGIQCALICVDELIESHLLLTTTHEREPSIRCKRYWKQVKQEIENL